MKLKFYQVDAFTDKMFHGNTAAVFPLDEWLPESLMQAIANENQLSETAFFVPANAAFELRWFTPTQEVDLCGHATLASAYVLYECLGYDRQSISFHTRSGELTVWRQGDAYAMRFPAIKAEPCKIRDDLVAGLGVAPKMMFAADDYLAVFDSSRVIQKMQPDFTVLKRLDRRGVIVTAPGQEVDFVSRFFAPNYGIDEDPVTGSAHCMLAPYWAEQLGKTHLRARQISRRGGDIECCVEGDSVVLIGDCVKYMFAEIELPTEKK